MPGRVNPVAVAAVIAALAGVGLAAALLLPERPPAPPAPAADLPPDHPAVPPQEPVLFSLQYWGEGCFLVTVGSGEEAVAVVLDPLDPAAAGERPPPLRAHFVTVSRERPGSDPRAAVAPYHGEELAVLAAGADPVSRGPATLRRVATAHDTEGGGDRGENQVFVVEAGGRRLVHLGGLDRALTEAQAEAIGRADVLLLPVGGHSTLGPEAARRVAEQLRARLIIPMRYRTRGTAPALADKLEPVEAFTVQYADVQFRRQDTELIHASDLAREDPAVRVLEPMRLP